MEDYRVIIRGKSADDDGWQTDLIKLKEGQPWYDPKLLPPCPDCGGSLVWAEAGNVPGTRRCSTCGSMFSVGCGSGATVIFRRERYY